MINQTSNPMSGSSNSTNGVGEPAMVNTPGPNTIRLTPKVYEHRRNNKLWFRCGEKYYPGHRCETK